MKKTLLVVVLAVALLGLLAAPAFAQPQFQDGYYLWVYDGAGFQVSNGEITGEFDPGTAVPAGNDVWLVTLWGAYGYGHVKSIGNAIVETLKIDDTWVVPDAAASKALWGMPYPSEVLNDIWTPFNPLNRVSGWVAAWLYPVTLDPGTYEVSGTETNPHPFTDLGVVAENHPGPLMYPRGSGDYGPWDLVLTP